MCFFFTRLEIKKKVSWNFDNAACAIFRKIKSLNFLNICIYSSSTNPLIFKNSNIEMLIINGLVNTLVKKNFLEFTRVNVSLNSTIDSVKLDFYRSSLTKKLLDPLVFEKTKELMLSGRIASIDNDLFYSLKSFKEINVENLDSFHFLKNGLKFLEGLNFNLKLESNTSENLKKNTVNFFILNYNFPVEDFCFFRNFPQNRLILVRSWTVSKCSCLQFWLFKSYFFDYGKKIIQENNICSNLKEEILCDFNHILDNCKKVKFSKLISKIKRDFYFDAQSLNFLMLILIPFFSFIGISSNLLSIATISIMLESSKFSRKMYKWMKINSIMNLFYSIIFLFHLMSLCLSIKGIYCPEISRSFTLQYYEIFVVDFVGGILKTLSNLITLYVSIERLKNLNNHSIQTSSRKKNYLKYIFVLLMIIITIALNTEKPLTSVVNKFDFDLLIDVGSYSEYPIRNSFKGVLDQKLPFVTAKIEFKAKNPLYYGLFISNFIYNDVILFAFISIVDLFLVLRYREKINEKKRILLNLFNNTCRKKSIEKVSSIRITTIVLVYSAFLLFFRILELIMNILVFKHSQSGERCDHFNSICTIYYQTGNFFYLITSSFTGLIYFFLDKNFRYSLKKLIGIES